MAANNLTHWGKLLRVQYCLSLAIPGSRPWVKDSKANSLFGRGTQEKPIHEWENEMETRKNQWTVTLQANYHSKPLTLNPTENSKKEYRSSTKACEVLVEGPHGWESLIPWHWQPVACSQNWLYGPKKMTDTNGQALVIGSPPAMPCSRRLL